MGDKLVDKARRQAFESHLAGRLSPSGQRRSKSQLTPKSQVEERKRKAGTFVGKEVVVGERIGIGVRVNRVSGSIVVRHGKVETEYNPDVVSLRVDQAT